MKTNRAKRSYYVKTIIMIFGGFIEQKTQKRNVELSKKILVGLTPYIPVGDFSLWQKLIFAYPI